MSTIQVCTLPLHEIKIQVLSLILSHYIKPVKVKKQVTLTLYAPCIILQCVDKPTRCTNSYKCSLFFIVWFYMLRAIARQSSGATSSKLYHVFGTFVQASLDWPARMYQIRDTVY